MCERWLTMAVLLLVIAPACDGDGQPAQGSASTATPAVAQSVVAARAAPAVGAAPSAPSAAVTASPSGSASADAGAGADAALARQLSAAEPRLAVWLAQARALRLQILIRPTRRDAAGTLRLGRARRFRVGAEYIYPASAIKPFLAVAALRTLATLGREHHLKLDAATRIRRCRARRPGCEPPAVDADKETIAGDAGGGEPRPQHDDIRIGEEIRKMLSYSDNDSYDRLWDIVGHRAVNEQMAALGFASVRFHHTMNSPAARSRSTRRVLLLSSRGGAVQIAARHSHLELSPTPATGLRIGHAYRGPRGMVDEPMSFAEKNHASLEDMQRLLLSLVSPTSDGAVDLGLSGADRKRIVAAMTGHLTPRGRASEHKPMLPGVLEVVEADHLSYVDKSGRAYGFHLDNAFIEDTERGRGVLVVATIYANPNGVLNDDDYGYDETTRPFLRALGVAVGRIYLAGDSSAASGF